MQLQEIAIRTGFNSLSSFSRRFKNYYQQTPGDCRRQARAT
ncbi:MAG: helix-turn-helix domain-containing protein [Gammaproteobacteria bacterium]